MSSFPNHRSLEFQWENHKALESQFPLIDDFRVSPRLSLDRPRPGLLSERFGALGSLDYWRSPPSALEQGIPLAPPETGLHLAGQGYLLVTWGNVHDVFIATSEGAYTFPVWFRVKRHRYCSEFRKVMEHYLYPDCATSVEQAVGSESPCRALMLDDQELLTVDARIGQLQHLEMLSLRWNYLTELPEFLADLPALTLLDVSGNPLGALPDWIGRLQNLRILRACGAGLTALPPAITALDQLESLVLTDNAIFRFPHEALDLPALSELSVWGNPFRDLPEAIAGTRLTYLTLPRVRCANQSVKELLPKADLYIAEQ